LHQTDKIAVDLITETRRNWLQIYKCYKWNGMEWMEWMN